MKQKHNLMHLGLLASMRMRKAIRRGNVVEAERWSAIAERIDRMKSRESTGMTNYQRSVAWLKEHNLRIEHMQKWPRGYR